MIIWVIVTILILLVVVAIFAFRRKNEQVKPEEVSHKTDFESDWYKGVAKQIHELKNTLEDKDYKKFRLDLLLNVAQRVAEFSSGCGQCMLFQQDISVIVGDVANLAQYDDKGKRRSYFKSLNLIVGHLQRQHKIVTEGYYMGICMAIGAGIGVALGVAMDHIGSGIPIGVGIGVAIGAALDAKAKKDGRVLYTKETAGSSKTVLAILVGLSLLVLVGLVVFMLFLRNG